MQKTLRKKYEFFVVSCNKENSTAVGILTDFYTALVQAESKITSLQKLLNEYGILLQRNEEELAAKNVGVGNG